MESNDAISPKIYIVYSIVHNGVIHTKLLKFSQRFLSFCIAMLSLFLPFLLTGTLAAVLSERQNLAGSKVCDQIAGNVAGKVYKPLDLTLHYASDINHYMTSSTQRPMCVVEVTSTEDVSKVLKIVGETRTPFAVKSGGHASNPGFSSTTGVHISLAKLTQVILSPDKSIIEIGLGNVRVLIKKSYQLKEEANTGTALVRHL